MGTRQCTVDVFNDNFVATSDSGPGCKGAKMEQHSCLVIDCLHISVRCHNPIRTLYSIEFRARMTAMAHAQIANLGWKWRRPMVPASSGTSQSRLSLDAFKGNSKRGAEEAAD